MGGFSPLWDAGFVGNPFRALSETEWEEAAILPPAMRFVMANNDTDSVQILGTAGHGKSSALRAVIRDAQWTDRWVAYEYIPHGAQSFGASVEVDGWFCLDEAQRLNPRERERLIELCREKNLRLFLGSHEDLTPLFNRARLPLATITLDTPEPAHFDKVLQNRLSRFARSGTPRASLTPDAFAFLRKRFGSDLRGAERFLFDVFQESVREPVAITGDRLRRESR